MQVEPSKMEIVNDMVTQEIVVALENEEIRKNLFGGWFWEQEVKYGTLLYDRYGNVRI